MQFRLIPGSSLPWFDEGWLGRLSIDDLELGLELHDVSIVRVAAIVANVSTA